MRLCILKTIIFALFTSFALSEKIEIQPFGFSPQGENKQIENDGENDFAESSFGNVEPVEAAKLYIAQNLGYIEENDYIIKSSYSSSNGVTHVYLKQIYKGKEIMNADFNINVGKEGNIISYGSTFTKKTNDPENSFDDEEDFWPSVEESLTSLSEKLNIEIEGVGKDRESNFEEDGGEILEGIESNQGYLINSDGDVRPVTGVIVDRGDNMIVAYIDCRYQVLAVNDLVHEAKYGVYPIGINDPGDGERQIVEDQGSSAASPYGWHDEGNGSKFTTTRGNNVIAYANHKGEKEVKNPEPIEGGSDLNFDFALDLTKEAPDYVQAAVTNLFYVTNMLHDVFYAHGFNEASGNFQNNNFDKGGLGDDAVNVQAQDGSGFNNANFATPRDGKRARMRMYIWNKSEPKRDGDLDNGIIIHEYTHGLSNRLTGGALSENCLTSVESRGMGEGWGDAMAIVFRLRKEHNRDTEFGIGAFVSDNLNGTRKFVYTTNMTNNPQTYNFTNEHKTKISNDYHAIGSIWTTILYEVLFNLIDKKGFSPDLLSGNTDHGNTLFIRLLIDGMKLQQCNPTFIQARNSIILADAILNNSDNKCEIWKGFAKRGLGLDSKFENNTAINGFELPEECR